MTPILLARVSHVVASNFSSGGKCRKLSVILRIPDRRTGTVYPMLMNHHTKVTRPHSSQGTQHFVLILKFGSIKCCFLSHFLITREKSHQVPSVALFLTLFLLGVLFLHYFPSTLAFSLFKVIFMRRPCLWEKAFQLPCI